MVDLSIKKLSSKTIQILFFVGSFILLFLGFYRNQWGMVHPHKFSIFQKDVEAYVIARMVLTRESGFFSYGGLLGYGDVDPSNVREEDYAYQYETYLAGRSFQTYWHKESNPGFQGIFFSVLDRASPFSPSNNLRLFRMFTSGMFAATLAGIVVWFYRGVGVGASVFVLISILTSQWMTVFGRNLFFMSGFFYLPMVLLLFRLEKEKNGVPLLNRQLFWVVLPLVLLKCLLNGYDFILPTLGMVASPLVYYAISYKWNKGMVFKRFLVVGAASLAAILVSFTILSFQIMQASGSFLHGFEYIVETINRRTVSTQSNLSPVYEIARKADYWPILKIYLSESYFYKFYVPYFVVIVIFAVATVVYCFVSGKIKNDMSDRFSVGAALIATTWFSLTGTLGWYIIFKSLSYFHIHMNYLPWHMPFTLFGFGMCGYMIESLVRQWRQ